MLLNDWLTPEFIASIPYIEENEKDKSQDIYYMLRMFYGKRTVSNEVDFIIENSIDSIHLANAISDVFSSKWRTVKSAITDSLPTTESVDTKTETTDNNIYGFNGDKAPDYNNVKTTEEHKTFDNLFEMIEKNIEIQGKLSYYRLVINDIAHMLTCPIYE